MSNVIIPSLLGQEGSGGAVSSVFGRTGDVSAQSGDYSSTTVTNASTVAGATVTAALDKLAGDLTAVGAGIADWKASVKTRTDTPPGSSVDGDRYLAGANPTGVWAGHANNIVNKVSGSWVFTAPNPGDAVNTEDTGHAWVYSGQSSAWNDMGATTVAPVTAVFGRTGAVSQQAGDYTASQITNVPAGGIAANTVQNAINELDTEKAPTTRAITAGAGLTGGGTLAADRTLQVAFAGSGSASTAARSDHAHAASAVANTPAGNIAATDVQAALNELDTQISHGIQTVNTMADLRALTPPASGSATVYLRGYYAPGDGGDGLFYWDAAANDRMVASLSISAAGADYITGDELVVVGGAGRPARARVQGVSSGAVTSVRLLDKGDYSATPSGSAATTAIWGSGCVLNLTFTNADDGGTVLAPTPVGAGRWKRLFSDPVNVRWFGAKGDGTADDAPAIMAALATNSTVYLPQGRYLVKNPIVPFDRSRLFGDNNFTSVLVGDATLNAPIILTFDKLTYAQREQGQGHQKQIVVRDVCLVGSCTHAIQLVHCLESLIENVRVEAGQGTAIQTTSHILYLEDSWCSTFRNIALNGATVDANAACVYVGRDMNACSIENLVTSSTNKYGIWQATPATGIAAQGMSYRNICLQGHSDTALWIESTGYGGANVNGIYTESCKTSIRLGNKALSGLARGVSIAGGILGTCTVAQAGICPIYLDWAWGVSLSGLDIQSVNHQGVILLNYIQDGAIFGCYCPDAPAQDWSRGLLKTSTAERVELFGPSFGSRSGSGQPIALIVKPNSWPQVSLVQAWINPDYTWGGSTVTIPTHA